MSDRSYYPKALLELCVSPWPLKWLAALRIQRTCLRGRDDTHSYEGAETVAALAALWIKITLFSSYLYGLVSRARELCPSLGWCPRGCSAFRPQVCLTKPLRGTLLPSPRGPGGLWVVPPAVFTPVPLPSSARLPILEGRPDLPLPGQNVYTGRGGSTDLCSCIYRRDRLLCVCFSPSLQEPVTVSSHVVTISSLTPATSYNCSVTTFSHNSPSVPTFIAVSTMGKQHFPALFFLLHLQHLFLFAFWSCSR